MGLYNRKLFDKHMDAIDAASSCISAAISGDEYAGRIAHRLDDFVEISELFVKNKRDMRDVARTFHRLVIGCKVSGLESFKLESILERCRLKVKGRLFMTRMILAEGDAKAKCNEPDNHTQPCKCRPLRLKQLADQEQS